MKSYINNLKGLFIKSIIKNFVIALASFLICLATKKPLISPKANMILAFLAMIFILLSFIMGRKKYQRSILKIKQNSLGEKLNEYDAATKKQLLYFTIMTITSSVCYIVSYQPLYLLFSILSIALIVLNIPNKSRLRFELNLKDEELNKIFEPINKKNNV
jgi:hypothetical protein